MTDLPANLGLEAVSLSMAVLMGLVFGMGPCLISCLPYLGPVFLAHDGGVTRSWRIMLPLGLGRVTAYGGMGLAAAMAGSWSQDVIGIPTIRLVVGGAAFLLGFALLLGGWPKSRHCRKGAKTAHPLGLFLMGIGMALTPCAPLGAVLTTAAASASPIQGLSLGVAFALGASTIPSLVYGLAVAHMGQGLRGKLGDWRPWAERVASLMLMVSGLLTLLR